MRRDSPAMVVAEVRKAVWRWRWRRLENKHPCLKQGREGSGPCIEPLMKLLQSKPGPDWGAKQQGALRSAIADRQWPQARLKSAGMVSSSNCQLCVKLGFCTSDDLDPKHKGTLLHRLWICPALRQERKRLVPRWLLAQVQQSLHEDCTMTPDNLLVFTRALAPSPGAFLLQAPQDETFEWVVQPASGQIDTPCTLYVDGSMLDANWILAGCCARRGWAFAAVDQSGKVIASARGRPPGWMGGINGAELWGLLMAAHSAFPGSSFCVDCQAVQVGAQRGAVWATAPDRQLARAWGPLASALEGSSDSVVWMPAHCTTSAVGVKTLSDGTRLSQIDLQSNELVDGLAKSAAQADRLPEADRKRVQKTWIHITAIARWIGQATVLANEFPHTDASGKRRYIRDSEAKPFRRMQQARAKVATVAQTSVSHGLFRCTRLDAMHGRVLAKQPISEVHAPTAVVQVLPLAPVAPVDTARRSRRRAKRDRRDLAGAAMLCGAAGGAPVTQVQASHSTQERRMKPAFGASSSQSPLETLECRKPSELALQDLLELEQCGLRVRLPRPGVLQAKTCKESQPATLSQQAAARTADSQAEDEFPHCETQPQELAAALEDLYELQNAGMRVRLPG